MFVRGFNPIWSFVDLTGLQMDDTYYVFFLQNTIPYIPQPVYMTSSGTPWSDPIQVLANGTLPDNIYFDPGSEANPNVWRIEIRKGPTQTDPLIYLIENYLPGGEEGTNPPSDVGFTTENQISNPQFAFISFTSPYTFSSSSAATLQIAPGWSIVLGAPAGTGSITLTQVALNNTSVTPTNAPYALQMNSSGWTSVTLVQQFSQNGMLWTSNDGTINNVAISLTAQTQGAIGNITAQLVDSNGTNLGLLLNNVQIDNGWNVYPGIIAPMPETTNPDLPPVAYIELQIINLLNLDIYLTSVQLVNSTEPLEYPYEETTIERQLDHLFHYYEPQLAFKPIPSYLVGWDFPLNPAQFFGRSGGPFATGANTSNYVWDQTIIFQTVDNSFAIGANNDFLAITATADTQISIIQYIEIGVSRSALLELLINYLSSNVRMGSTVAQNINVSIWSTTNANLPDMSTNQSFINSLDSKGHPATFVSGWTEIKRINFQDANATVGPGTQDYGFSGWESSTAYLNGTFLAIAIGTDIIKSGNLVSILSASLVPGLVPTIPAPQTMDEVLRECQYYYETSYSSLTDFTANPVNNILFMPQSSENFSTSLTQAFASPLCVSFRVEKRANPNMGYFSVNQTSSNVSAILYYDSGGVFTATSATDKVISTYWNTLVKTNNFYFTPKLITPIQTVSPVSAGKYNSAGIQFHYVADSRLGIVN